MIRLPLPPGHPDRRCGATTSGSSHAYLSAFPGYYLTGDGGYVDDDGYVFVHGPHRRRDQRGRAPAVHRRRWRRCIAAHPAVAECAVIGVGRRAQGPGAARAVVLKAGASIDPASCRAELVAAGARPRSAPSPPSGDVDVVPALPKTRSGKILRKTMREIADGKTPAVPSTIEDAGVLDALRPVLVGDD